MHHERAIRVLFISIWLTVGASLPAVSLAEAYDDAVAALADGEYRTAYRDFKRLARQDHPKAQYQLGMLFLFGQGVEMDVTQGVEWLKRAANNGSYLAANELGQIYISGRGVAPDEQEAVKWVELATRLAQENPAEADEGCE